MAVLLKLHKSHNSLIVGETGLNSTINNAYINSINNIDDNNSVIEQVNFFNNINQISFNSNGQINSESLNMLRESLSQQSKLIQERVKMQRETEELLNINKRKNNPLIQQIDNKKNKKESKKSKFKKILNDPSYSSMSDINYIPQYESDDWIDSIFG